MCFNEWDVINITDTSRKKEGKGGEREGTEN